MIQGWQLHPSTGTAHFFAAAETRSACKRESRTIGGELHAEPGVLPCSHCRRRMAKIGAPTVDGLQTNLFGEAITNGEALTKVTKPKRTGHAAPPGSGPAGETCRTCDHYCRVAGGARAWPKCGLMRHAWSHGPGSDIRASSPACNRFEAKKDASP